METLSNKLYCPKTQNTITDTRAFVDCVLSWQAFEKEDAGAGESAHTQDMKITYTEILDTVSEKNTMLYTNCYL